MNKNPILRGFNPDPSIIRVGDDYYIATSTFEWFPGVQIHHSRDLKNWTLVSRALDRKSQLDMVGNPDSCGVWAPCLSYHNGIFYLVFSNVRSFDGVWKDTPNYLVTTEDILGTWSEPVFLNSSGFDGSLFHDNDGKKWYTSMLVDHRGGKFFGGIILQEYNPITQQLEGEVYHIFEGTALGVTEAPHLYKKNGFYYLITAEGGTEYGHAVSLARSKSINGPYEIHPANPIITTRHDPDADLQKCGHADLVEGPGGNWFAVFLVGRPLNKLGRCTLGRETAIAEVEWREDDWLYLKNGTKSPELELPSVLTVENSIEEQSVRDDFDQLKLNIHFQSLRVPIMEQWASLAERKGYLRLCGRESLSSTNAQSLLARRVQHFNIEASTCLEFEPKSFQQMAGLICYYNTKHWFYLNVLGGEIGPGPQKKYLQITSCNNAVVTEHLESLIELSKVDRIFLKVEFNREHLQFFYAIKENEWIKAGDTLDGSILSDDYVRMGGAQYRPAFTGSFVGICCQDLTGNMQPAYFDWFEYKEK